MADGVAVAVAGSAGEGGWVDEKGEWNPNKLLRRSGREKRVGLWDGCSPGVSVVGETGTPVSVGGEGGREMESLAACGGAREEDCVGREWIRSGRNVRWFQK